MPIDQTSYPAILAALADAVGRAEPLRAVYAYEAVDLSALPAAAIYLERSERQPVALAAERAESELGRVDLFCAWAVRLFGPGDYAADDEQAALRALGSVVAEIDADETLGGAVRSASVESAQRERIEIGERTLLSYVVTVTTASMYDQPFE